MEKKTMITAVRAYDAQTLKELSFEKGEEFQLLDDSQKWWFACSHRTKMAGYVPSNYFTKTSTSIDQYVSSISRIEAEKILSQPGIVPGSYILRISESSKQGYSLDVYDGEVVLHIRISTTKSGALYIVRSRSFESLGALVKFYQETTLKGISSKAFKLTACCSEMKPTNQSIMRKKDELEVSRNALKKERLRYDGAYHEVWDGQWHSTPATIKVAKHKTLPQNSLLEIKIMKTLHHPNIVQLYAVCSLNDPITLVLEHIRNAVRLSDHLHEVKDQVSLKFIVQVAAQVTSAMDYIAKSNIAHCRLKASSIQLINQEWAKVTNFYYSRRLKHNQCLAYSGMRFRWCSPEMINTRVATSKSDVWSFGVLLYEMVTCGKTPYEGIEPGDIINLLESGYRLPCPPGCADALYKIMLDCWIWTPELRPDFSQLLLRIQHIKISGNSGMEKTNTDFIKPHNPPQPESPPSTTDEKTEMEFVKQHIVEQGSLKLRVVKSVFYGPPAVGKTCTRKRLTGKMTNLGSRAPLPSTGIEKPCTISLFHKTEQCSVLLTKSFKEWEEQDVALQCQTLLERIILDSQNDSDQTDYQLIEEFDQHSPVQMSLEPDVPSIVADHSIDHFEAPPIHSRSLKSSLPLSLPPRNLPKDGALEKLINNITSTKQWKAVREGLKAIEDITILHITDTGGQPEFYDILPLLLQGPAIFLLFLNLTRRIDEHCEVGYRWETGSSSIEYESQFTVKEMLFQLLVSVASHTTDTLNTAVMLIGTHLDHVGAEGLRSREKELKDVVQSTELFKKDVIKSYTQDDKKSLIFPLDNIDGSVDEVKKLRELIASVIEQAFKPISLPTSWLLFHLVLRSEYEANPGYCTMEQCREVAKSCGIPPGSIVNILKFMHKSFGTVLYYSEVPSLANVVICDPNIIFMRATKLVTLSFGANPYRPNTTEQIRQFGEIDPSLMEEEKKKEMSPFSMQHVVELFTHYNIISQMKKFDGSHVFFMPCLLLPDPTVGREEKQVLSGIDPAPLLILFSTGYVPLGLFSALIVYLSKLGSWVIDPEERRYKNKVQFVIDKRTCTNLELKSHIDCLELCIKSPESSIFATVCPHVVSTLKTAIEFLKSYNSYFKFHNSLGFYCSSGLKGENETPHAAVCLETDSPQASWSEVSPKYMRCQSKPKCVSSNTKLLDKHKVWFLQISSTSADMDKAECLVSQQPQIPHVRRADDPTTGVIGTRQLAQLMVLLSPLVNWYGLGLQLGIYVHELRKIDLEQRGSVDRCLVAVLERWMQEADGVKEFGGATKEQLVSALQKIEEITLSETIAKSWL